MATFVDGPVRVSVPASSANLGPGFDSLGLALDLRDRLEAEVIEKGLVIEVDGAGAGEVPLDETHLVIRSMRATFDALGAAPSGVRLSCANVIPHGRGLGSSSAAIVGGVSLARALVAGGSLVMDDVAVFELCAALEGHPDNVAPAFYGGFLICGRDDDGFYAVRSDVDPRVSAVVLVPPVGVSTQLARGLLPDAVPHGDAAANSGRTALLVAALACRPDQLMRATRDYLHQDYRRQAMPDTWALVEAMRADGIAATVSGAGPSVLAFTDSATSPGTRAVLARCPTGWRALHLAVDTRGAVVR